MTQTPMSFRIPSDFWWQDHLRVSGYARLTNIYRCPSDSTLALACRNRSGHWHELGGVNLHCAQRAVGFGAAGSRRQMVSRPSTFIIFADAGKRHHQLPGTIPTPTTGCRISRSIPPARNPEAMVPLLSHAQRYGHLSDSEARSVPRHSGRCNFGFFDGHAATMRNSQAGYQYYTKGYYNIGAVQPEEAWWARCH